MWGRAVGDHQDVLRVTASFAGFRHVEVGGLPLLYAEDARFKTVRLVVEFRRPLAAPMAASRSILPGLLLLGTEDHPDRPSLARRMDDLHGAVVVPATAKVGETHVLRLVLDAVSGRFLPGAPDQIREGLALLAEILTRPKLEAGAFPVERFERERRQALDSIRAERDDPGRYALSEAVRRACVGEPMAVPEHGGAGAVEALDAAQPAAALADFLACGEVVLGACGAFQESELLRGVERFLDRLPVRSPEVCPGPLLVPPRDARSASDDLPLRQSKLVQVHRFDGEVDADGWLARNLFVGMLGGSPSSRLFREVRERHSLAYYASSSLDRHKGLMHVQVGLERKAAAAVREQIAVQIEELRAGRFEDVEIDTARAQLVEGILGVDDAAATRCRFALGQWALGIDRSPEDAVAACSRVGRDEIIAAARSLWMDFDYLLAGEGAPA
jgi:predicted Zn-dependent peptidase